MIALALAALADPIAYGPVKEWLAIAPVDNAGRRPFRPDAVFAKHLLARKGAPPEKGAELAGELGKQTWRTVVAGADGKVSGKPGWAYARIESEASIVVAAKLTGASRMYVNAAGFVGDLYGVGLGAVPIALKRGSNDVYVTGIRDSFALELAAIEGSILLSPADTTRPDVLAASGGAAGEAAVMAWNATTGRNSWVLASGGDLFAPAERSRIEVPPLCPRKLVFTVALADGKFAPKTEKTAKLPVRVHAEHGDARDYDASFVVDVRQPNEARRYTYRSRIDDSVQWAAYLPAVMPPDAPPSAAPRLVVTLHGANVDAFNQVRSYAPRMGFAFCAPTNRRAYGFDWQDWGARDAYEAFSTAPLLATDVSRAAQPVDRSVFLTGHSMGGHGTWHLAANDPDSFDAIAPSAGWASFDTYGGGRPDGALKSLWRSADATSDTLALVSNLAQIPTFILHGEADDNVPVSEAKAMEKALTDAGAKPKVHYEPKAGHWWDDPATPGTDCVDWAEIFELFRSARQPADWGSVVDFATFEPRQHRWIWIEELERCGELARIKARIVDGTLKVETTNVRRFSAAPESWDRKSLSIDGASVDVSKLENTLNVVHGRDGWRLARASDDATPRKGYWGANGPFKAAFDRNFVFVYGTLGSDDEDRELFERARSDAEVWWYRANATPDIVTDVDFKKMHGDRNVILYGNAETNAAWEIVLGFGCPIEAVRGKLKLGDREWKGDDLAAVFVFPRTDGQTNALVGAFTDTGLAGMRVGYTLAPFVSGVGYPDYAIYSSEVLSKGDGGVLAAGFFDHEWRPDARGYVRDAAKK